MRVYILDADANRHNVYFVHEADWDRLERLDATPLASAWAPLTVQAPPGQPPGDYPNFQGVASACVFSGRAVEVLGDLLEGRGELLPLTSEAGKSSCSTSPASPMPSIRSRASFSASATGESWASSDTRSIRGDSPGRASSSCGSCPASTST